MKYRILVLITLLILAVSSSSIVKASDTGTLTPLGDTFVDGWQVTQSYGDRDYLEVSEYANGLSIVLLMFDISNALSAPSEVKLRLYCFDVESPHVVGVHWCVNNTWKEENLTFVSFGRFFRTNLEDAVVVDSIDVWYEWKVTGFVSTAMEENHENITLTLEVEDQLGGTARSRFASKDQPTQEMREYSPQLVFTYLEPKADSLDTRILVALGLIVTAIVIFLAYKFLRKSTTKTRHRKTQSKKTHRRRKEKRT